MSDDNQLDLEPDGTPRANNRKRNLVNQRNFRARRKEYIEELEAKVHDYEKNGIATAQQMQEAARLKIAENDILRQIIQTQIGWSPEDIEAAVHQALSSRQPVHQHPSSNISAKTNGNGHMQNGNHLNSAHLEMDGSAPNRQRTPRSPLETIPGQAMDSASHTTSVAPDYRVRAQVQHTDDWMMVDRPSPGSYVNPSPPPPIFRNGSDGQATTSPYQYMSRPELDRGWAMQPTHGIAPRRPSALAHTSSTSNGERKPANPAVMSCDDAASILAELAGQGSKPNQNGNHMDTIKAELGCRSAEPCEVSHQDVFERMARKM
ncbi:uncharacterized protein AB675_5494 [Cyphellophora attinorum]|uniref:BZIP domain-containing protein n=1 Tax=Cyphellophora attinorum TaxID=1664694 RepID=A0A0N1HCP1_9EURO|nr:uncharacterized protein AB675_5494 [Phialophora attinorum]KPI42182.1 hypothetical protein AB675_5494 [Phialophora attinorum]